MNEEAEAKKGEGSGQGHTIMSRPGPERQVSDITPRRTGRHSHCWWNPLTGAELHLGLWRKYSLVHEIEDCRLFLPAAHNYSEEWLLGKQPSKEEAT